MKFLSKYLVFVSMTILSACVGKTFDLSDYEDPSSQVNVNTDNERSSSDVANNSQADAGNNSDATSTDASNGQSDVGSNDADSTDSADAANNGTLSQLDAGTGSDAASQDAGSTDSSADTAASQDAGSVGASNSQADVASNDVGSTDTVAAADASQPCQAVAYFQDSDGDKYGNVAVVKISCVALPGYVTDSTDCNDTNAAVHPGATEVCNAIDDNCNGTVDEGIQSLLYVPDADKDGFGDITAAPLSACATPTGYVLADSAKADCNDNAVEISPAATEDCGNGVDDNCNSITDEGCTITITIPKLGKDYNLDISYEIYTKASSVGSGWDNSLSVAATDTVSIDFGHDSIDIGKEACGVRMSVTMTDIKTGAQAWLCTGNGKTAKLMTGTFFDLFWNSFLFTEADPEFMIWSAPNKNDGCSLIFVKKQDGACKF